MAYPSSLRCIVPPPTDSEAASMQCLVAINAGMPAIPEPEDHGADLDLPPHNMLPPNKVTEPHIHQPPKQIKAPTEAGGQLESFWGKQIQHAMDYIGLTLVRAPEGKMPIG